MRQCLKRQVACKSDGLTAVLLVTAMQIEAMDAATVQVLGPMMDGEGIAGTRWLLSGDVGGARAMSLDA